MRIFTQLKQWLERWLPRPSNVIADPAYQNAHAFKDLYAPREGVDYTWIKAYAHESYDRLVAAHDTLDAKAESIIKLLGGGAGVLTAGAILNVSTIRSLNWLAIITFVIALLAALIAITLAARVREPSSTFLPPSIAWALRYADYHEQNAENKFLAQWHLACEGKRLALSRKSWGVKLATWLAVAAFWLLALAFMFAIIY